ncbi:hypothetical protein PSHT_12797 [Puccinia striiformis]|uniref:Uncharacterized protein n=1 Tax=Puccinia striiformis TaxID=27350 RepID=A0A2S4UUG3_9BASI|nr:hypothetical protein PSHT_12797 [Puccinia striiformis]
MNEIKDIGRQVRGGTNTCGNLTCMLLFFQSSHNKYSVLKNQRKKTSTSLLDCILKLNSLLRMSHKKL